MKHMSNSEYESLRAESISRIHTITALDNSVLVVTGSLWAAVAAISGNLLGNNTRLRLIIQMVLLTIAAVLIIVAALKNWENVHQITVITAYLKVFYEYPSRHSSKKQKIFSWETVQMRTNTLGNTKWSKQKSFLYRTFYNGSYFILEVATGIIMVTVLFDAGLGKQPLFNKAIILFALAAFECVMLGMLYRLTFVDSFTDEKQKKLLLIYAEQAIELGVINDTMYSLQPKMKPAEIIADEIIREMRTK